MVINDIDSITEVLFNATLLEYQKWMVSLSSGLEHTRGRI